jgi:hypothetical protein
MPNLEIGDFVKISRKFAPQKTTCRKKADNPHIEHAFILTNLQAPTGNL